MNSDDLRTDNILLNSLDAQDRALLAPLLTRCDLAKDMMLHLTGKPIARCYFVEAGIASSVAVNGGSRTEVGLVGYDGVTGANAILGDDLSPFDTFIQVDGGTALWIGTQDLHRAMAASTSLQTLLLGYTNTFMLQLAFGLVACAQHLMEARLARWLLMCHDRVDGDTIPLTHEFMALMIAAQRSGVTMTLHSLEGAGMIRSTRGLVTIRDREKMLDLAGDSYGKPEERYRALIAPFGKGG